MPRYCQPIFQAVSFIISMKPFTIKQHFIQKQQHQLPQQLLPTLILPLCRVCLLKSKLSFIKFIHGEEIYSNILYAVDHHYIFYRNFLENLYSLSHMWINPIAMLAGVIVGALVSLCTGEVKYKINLLSNTEV